MKVIPKKTFLIRQEELEGGKKKDIIARKGIKIEMTDRDAIRFWGGLELSEEEKKRLLHVSKRDKISRVI